MGPNLGESTAVASGNIMVIMLLYGAYNAISKTLTVILRMLIINRCSKNVALVT